MGIGHLAGYDSRMASRDQNERTFPRWEVLPTGGRRYWLDVPGHRGWRARYVKEVDANETTLKFWQEIYDEKGLLIEVHHKFPVDEGHRRV